MKTVISKGKSRKCHYFLDRWKVNQSRQRHYVGPTRYPPFPSLSAMYFQNTLHLIYFVICVHESLCTSGVWRTIQRNWFYLSTIWIPGMELGFSGLIAMCLYPLGHLFGPTILLLKTSPFLAVFITVSLIQAQSSSLTISEVFIEGTQMTDSELILVVIFCQYFQFILLRHGLYVQPRMDLHSLYSRGYSQNCVDHLTSASQI